MCFPVASDLNLMRRRELRLSQTALQTASREVRAPGAAADGVREVSVIADIDGSWPVVQ
jgi:hypothetical protein